MTTPRRPDQMVTRLAPGAPRNPAGGLGHAVVRNTAPKFNIVISSSVDGAELVRMTEDERGCLVVTGNEARWDEGAKRFLHEMMQWSGLVGINWKSDVVKAVEE
jgi:hypothetical protein